MRCAVPLEWVARFCDAVFFRLAGYQPVVTYHPLSAVDRTAKIGFKAGETGGGLAIQQPQMP